MSVKTRIQELNTRLAEKLTNKGVQADGSETTTALIDKVDNIVNKIPDGYIKPEGSIPITENGTFDVREKAEVNVNVPISDGLVYDMGTFVLDADSPCNGANMVKVSHNLGKVPRMIIVWTDDFSGITEPPYSTDTNLGFVWFDKFMGMTQLLTSVVDSQTPFCSYFYMPKNSTKARWLSSTSNAYGLLWLPTDTEFTCTYNGGGTYWRAGVEYKYFVSDGFWQ